MSDKNTMARVAGFAKHLMNILESDVQPHLPEDDAKITLPQVIGCDRLVFFFHPDRTVSFENIWMQPVGRVSYIDKSGNYKKPD